MIHLFTYIELQWFYFAHNIIYSTMLVLKFKIELFAIIKSISIKRYIIFLNNYNYNICIIMLNNIIEINGVILKKNL